MARLPGQCAYRSFRSITSFWQVIRMGIEEAEADIVLVDVGPSLGAINRSALIATIRRERMISHPRMIRISLPRSSTSAA